jgi:hypothetical protein
LWIADFELIKIRNPKFPAESPPEKEIYELRLEGLVGRNEALHAA